MGLFEKAKALASNTNSNRISPTEYSVKKKSSLIERIESLGLNTSSDLDSEINTSDFSNILKEVEDNIVLDFDEVDSRFNNSKDNLENQSNFVEEREEYSEPEQLSEESNSNIEENFQNEELEEQFDEVLNIDDLPDFPEEDQNLETTFYSDETPEKEPSLENFKGEQETIDIGENDSISVEDFQKDEITPEETIDLDDPLPVDSGVDDPLAEWEKDVQEQADKDSLSVEDEIMDQISKEDLIAEDLEKSSIESLTEGLAKTQEEINNPRDEVNQDELDALQRRTESYLVLVEISKELVKSKNFEDFYENLMYSIEGEIGPEAIMIFAAKEKSLKEFHLLTYDGVEVDSEIILPANSNLIRIIKEIGQVCVTGKINLDKLSGSELMIIDNPSSEVIAPLWYEKELIGFMVCGKLINDEDYNEEDFEFLKLLGDLAGNFIMKMFDIVKIRDEVSHLNESIRLHESVSNLSDALYSCKSIDELYKTISSKLEKEFYISKHTLFLTSEKDNLYKAFSSNYFSPETVANLSISSSSKLVTLVSQVTGMYKIENFGSYTEFKEMIPEKELNEMKEFSVFPLIHMGKLFGMLAIHEIKLDSWSSDLKQMVISASNIISPVLVNFILQTEKDVVFKNPFNPVQESVDREMEIANKENARFTLVVLKILNVSRIINLLGLEFFTSYSDFIISKIQSAVSETDYFSRVGQGKFAIFLRGKNKAQSDDFFGMLKKEFVKFPNPPKDFKLSLQLYSLTYPEQAKDKRRFIEIIEDT